MADWVSLPLSYTVPRPCLCALADSLGHKQYRKPSWPELQKKAIQWRPLESKLEWNHLLREAAQASSQEVSGDLL